MEKVALFIAGDENIYFPALVAIESIKKYNPGSFDFFLCFDKEKLSLSMEKTLSSLNVKFIDTKELDKYSILENFTKMHESIWPVDVFYNYALPIYLKEKGYKYSCKADYDILCVAKYEMEKIIPDDVVLSGFKARVNLLKEGMTEKSVNESLEKNIFSDIHSAYMNVGFILFNNDLYCENDFLGKFKKAYKFLVESSPKAKLHEQLAFASVLNQTRGSFKDITEAYNHRVLATRDTDEKFMFDTKNFHYITRFKPWMPLDKSKTRWFIDNGGSCLYAYRNIWLEFAMGVPGFAQHCSEKPMSAMQLIGMQMYTNRRYNFIIQEIRKK